MRHYNYKTKKLFQFQLTQLHLITILLLFLNYNCIKPVRGINYSIKNVSNYELLKDAFVIEKIFTKLKIGNHDTEDMLPFGMKYIHSEDADCRYGFKEISPQEFFNNDNWKFKKAIIQYITTSNNVEIIGRITIKAMPLTDEFACFGKNVIITGWPIAYPNGLIQYHFQATGEIGGESAKYAWNDDYIMYKVFKKGVKDND